MAGCGCLTWAYLSERSEAYNSSQDKSRELVRISGENEALSAEVLILSKGLSVKEEEIEKLREKLGKNLHDYRDAIARSENKSNYICEKISELDIWDGQPGTCEFQVENLYEYLNTKIEQKINKQADENKCVLKRQKKASRKRIQDLRYKLRTREKAVGYYQMKVRKKKLKSQIRRAKKRMRGETLSSSSSVTPDALNNNFQTDFQKVAVVLEKIYVDAMNECNNGFSRQCTRDTSYESRDSLAELSEDDCLSYSSGSADRSNSFVGSPGRASFSDCEEEILNEEILDEEVIVSRESSSGSFTTRTWSSVNSNQIDAKKKNDGISTVSNGRRIERRIFKTKIKICRYDSHL